MHIANRSPEFCIIAPTKLLHVTKQSKSHLVLAHLVDTDPEYRQFYNSLSDDHFIIMDNGAFELGESYAPEKLVDLGRACNANVIVLPDYPNQHYQKTIDASESVIDDIRAAGFKTMFVPQSEKGETDQWLMGYDYAANNPHIDMIGMSILGIPNAIPHIHIAYARVVMTMILIDRNLFNYNKHHHYLGLNSGPKLEIPSLLALGALDTCDSSNPVWSAILGHEYSKNTDSLLSIQKPKMHVNFDYDTSNQEILDRINHNINLTLELFK